jgi:hypothetical protein
MDTRIETTRNATRSRMTAWGTTVLVAAGLALGACQEPPEGEEAQAQSLTAVPVGPEAAFSAVLKGIGYFEHEAEQEEMRQAFAQIEGKLDTIEDEVVAVSNEQKKQELRGVQRDIDRDRSQKVQAVLLKLRDTPSLANSLEVDPSGVALTYAKDSFYFFSGPNSINLTRFDYRLALPTLMEAVDTWLEVHKIGRLPLTQDDRNQLRAYAGVLDRVVSRINSNVSCWTHQTSGKVVINGQKKQACSHTPVCVDKIRVTSSTGTTTRSVGSTCAIKDIPDAKRSAALRVYHDPGSITAIATKWRAIANDPESIPLCGQNYDNDCCPDGTCSGGLACIDFGSSRSCLTCGGHDDYCCANDVCEPGLRCQNRPAGIGGGRACLYDTCGKDGQFCCEDTSRPACASGLHCNFDARCQH